MASKPWIRPAAPGDIEKILDLCAEHAAFEQEEFSLDGKADALRHALFDGVPRLRCFVVEAGNSLAGYATVTRDFSTWKTAEYLHMDCLYIAPGHRDAGLGAEMMHRIARNASALGCATLEWQTPPWNTGAARFYER